MIKYCRAARLLRRCWFSLPCCCNLCFFASVAEEFKFSKAISARSCRISGFRGYKVKEACQFREFGEVSMFTGSDQVLRTRCPSFHSWSVVQWLDIGGSQSRFVSYLHYLCFRLAAAGAAAAAAAGAAAAAAGCRRRCSCCCTCNSPYGS